MEYKIKPKENLMMNALTDSEKHAKYIFLECGIGFAIIMIAVLFPVPAETFFSIFKLILIVCALGVTCIESVKMYMKSQSATKKLTDIKESYLNIEDGWLNCYQATGENYEGCKICISEITSIVETKDKKIYIQFNTDTGLSFIFIGGQTIPNDFFEIDGTFYDTDELIAFMDKLQSRLAETVTYDENHMYWKSKRKKINLYYIGTWLIIPGVFLIGIVIRFLL